jgi:dipeptidyl aminopeptidase/acylaminoacyl peptidase
MMVFTTGGDDSGTYWIVDIKTGAADPIGYEYPTVRPEHVGPIRMIQWKAQDGTVIHGVLSLPPGRLAKNLPVVVLPHGGPEARDYPEFDWWAQAFASRGYAVLQPNFRGSSGYGVAFRDAGFGQWGRKMQTDISDGLADLARQGMIDPKRACIVGASYGGYAALAGVTVQHGLYRCAVAVAGVSDPADMIHYAREENGGDESSSTRYWKKFMGDWSALPEISPVRQAASADAPILLIHGKDDTVVPFAQSAAMQRALLAAHKPVDLVVLPGEDHWFSREATRTRMLTSSVAFVEKYNPPD